MEERDQEPNQDYLDLFERILEQEAHKWDSEESKQNNLEWDLVTTQWILDRVRDNDYYAQNLYAALCNNSFQKLDTIPILTDEWWSCSWRYAGGIIADMRQQGDYIDWYCSGIAHSDVPENNGYVQESVVTEEIREDLRQLGWIVHDD